MKSPVFEEIDPASDCDCPGCVRGRGLFRSPAARTPARPAAAHRALVVAAVTAATLGAGQAVPAAAATHTAGRPPGPRADQPPGGESGTPQGDVGALFGPDGPDRPDRAEEQLAIGSTTRSLIVGRAKRWLDARVPYNMSRFWRDGYRQDCSGFVSMAWNLPRNEWTGSLGRYAVRITKEQLQPGDILLFHNPANPQKGSHVVLFGGWKDRRHISYVAYEQVRPHTRRITTPYAYWTNSKRFVPYRYKGLTRGVAGPAATSPAPYPGTGYFGPGADNPHVARLGRMLAARGGASYYAKGPGSRWSEADRRATRAFQRAQGWTGAAADGLPGPGTWRLLVTGKGKDIKAAAPASHGVPGYPGRGMFRPGADNRYVTELGRQLVRKGYGRFYRNGPGPRWSDADRRAVEAFQRAQGWRGGAADGLPGPETWRRLFA
ncbi:peptidoglycan-binding protein [Streptomyces sp. NPDC094153]|uniref:peptidoglycan-binding protein n=1 Tax=Streptomyces sp. NPDC094153 TaxID=3366058 RepID=UPI0037FDFEA7